MDKHLTDVSKTMERLSIGSHHHSKYPNEEYKQFTLEDARVLQKQIDEKIEALLVSSDIDDEKEAEDCEPSSSSLFLGCDSVEKQGFFDKMAQDQIDAGRYLLSKLNKRYHNNQSFSCYCMGLRGQEYRFSLSE